jgi:Ca-activated chloride channel homolog
MRLVLAALMLVVTPGLAWGQGSIVPRCPVERECVPFRPGAPQIVRTSSHVKVELRDRVLRFEISETFRNRGGALGEADYLFPLRHGAAFEQLELSIDGKLVAGETMNAAEARRIYEEIVARQRDPALVEWIGHGMLRTRIFPIAAGEERQVVVRYQMVAPREGDALRVDYTRGMPASDLRGAEATSFLLSYPAGAGFGTPYSPTHTLTVSSAGAQRRVVPQGAGGDLTVLLPLPRQNAAAIAMLPHHAGGEDGFALITITPPPIPAGQRAAGPRDVTFVLDVSGSMRGPKMEQARQAGISLLATLRPIDRFRLIDFAGHVNTFRDEFVFANRENLAEARRYLEALSAQGGTNISGALEEALRERPDRRAEHLPIVIFVTDGEPTAGERDPEAIGALAAGLSRGHRIFTFGVGSDVNVSLVEQLALRGRGTAHFVAPTESVERAVSVVAQRIAEPVLTDVRVRAEGVRLSRMHPEGPIDIYAGQDVVLLARYVGRGPGTIVVEGRTTAGPVRWSTRVEFPERERDNAFIPRLWATQRVGHLSAERRRHGPSQELDDEIRLLGERYGIPTELTSYLVLEPGMVAGRAQPAAPREVAFESARAASMQRSVASVADVDRAEEAARARMGAGAGAGASPPPSPRRAGSRTFVMRDSTWTDTRHKEGTRLVKVKPYSAAWFAVLDALPELRTVPGVGDKVVVAGRRVSVAIAADGMERITRAELDALRAGW